jgi:uncharacterized membrane-anchored protein
MDTKLIILVLIVLLGGVGSYYGNRKAGWRGLSAVVTLVVLSLVFLWLFVKVGGV